MPNKKSNNGANAPKTSQVQKKSNVEKDRAIVLSAPVSKATKMKAPKAPSISNRNDGSCTISHLEFVQDITGLSTTASVVHPVNPQRSAVFTWLSAIATRYEMYRFEKLKFHYRPSCSTATGGWVALGFDFDSYDETPTKATMLAWKYSGKCAPWQEMTLDVSTDARLATFRYLDSQTRGDKRLDLLGNLVILASTAATEFVGELMVEYQVTFRQPAYKDPPALFHTTVTESEPTKDNWFLRSGISNLVKNVGNMAVEIVDKDTLQINDIGSFIVTAASYASATLGGVPSITFSVPASSPNSDYSDSALDSAYSSVAGVASRLLKVKTAPVLVNFAQGANGTTPFFYNVRIGTYNDA